MVGYGSKCDYFGFFVLQPAAAFFDFLLPFSTHRWYNIETAIKEVVSLKKAFLITLCVLLLLGILGTGVCYYIWQTNEFALELSLLGDTELTLEYGSVFSDPGASAVFYGSLLEKQPQMIPVTVQGTVDTGKVGTYTLSYTVSHTADYRLVSKTLSKQLQRIIHIVDTQAPSISLQSVDRHYTLPGTAYEEEGFAAFDDYDGDITHLVTATEKDGTVTYTVTDSSGNSATVSREIFYDDPIAPVITLTDGDVDVQKDTEFVDPGFTAMDNCDGDLTANVTVSGEVNMDKAGVYTLTYTVSDCYGNTASAKRVVTVFKNLRHVQIVIPEPALEPTGKVIYLTYDDGPGKYTAQLLDILAKYDVKATFFVTCKGNSGLLARMAKEGHTVAIHTASHDYYSIYASEEAYMQDFYAVQNLIYSQTGKLPTLFRFPGGSGNTISSFNPGIMSRLVQLLTGMGYIYFDWSVDSGDAVGAGSPKEIFYNVVEGIGNRKTSVVLQHDIYEASVYATEMIIQWGLANGYTFKALNSKSPTAHHGVRN